MQKYEFTTSLVLKSTLCMSVLQSDPPNFHPLIQQVLFHGLNWHLDITNHVTVRK